MTPAEIVREGRNQLFERGWYQGGLEGPDGSLCALGAIRSSGHLDEVGDALAFLSAAAGQRVAAFNDAPGRTFSEVVDVFDKAEKLAEAREYAD